MVTSCHPLPTSSQGGVRGAGVAEDLQSVPVSATDSLCDLGQVVCGQVGKENETPPWVY